ncbi:MAG TPA: glycosyltransferase [Blastocatellia bacterium]|nr:glycosyltransferase [Blastocatellia bacterium]
MLALILGAACLVGLLLNAIQVLSGWRLMRSGQSAGKRGHSSLAHGDPYLSILKPVCGLDDELEENLASFAALTGISCEVIVSISDPNDPAIQIVDAVTRRFPDAPFSVVVGGATPSVANPKVERLIAALRIARGEIVLISDSNVRVSAGDIAPTIALFEDRSVGCVSNPVVAQGAVSFGSILESLHLLTFVAPGSLLADAADITCVMGKSMAIRREALERIGGFESFAGVLAEDQAMALAIRNAGYRIKLAPIFVRNITVSRSLGDAVARQSRWGKIRYAFSKWTYTAEFLVNPFPLALLACVAGAVDGPRLDACFVVATAVMGLRLITAHALSLITGTIVPWRRLLLVPVQDILQFAIQFVPFVSNEVVWRGHRARIGPGTVMMASKREERSAVPAPLEERPA